MTPDGPAETSHGELVHRIREGDRRAEEELLARFGEGMGFLLRRWTRDRDAADDLYQETFRLAIEKIRRGEVRDPERLPGFLRSLAKNLSTDHYRRDSKKEVREDDLESAADLSAQESEPVARLIREEKAALVRRLIGELPSDRDRQVLYRFYLAEEDKELIQADLGLSSPEFNMVLFRARRRYRDLVEKRAASLARGG